MRLQLSAGIATVARTTQRMDVVSAAALLRAFLPTHDAAECAAFYADHARTTEQSQCYSPRRRFRWRYHWRSTR